MNFIVKNFANGPYETKIWRREMILTYIERSNSVLVQIKLSYIVNCQTQTNIKIIQQLNSISDIEMDILSNRIKGNRNLIHILEHK